MQNLSLEPYPDCTVLITRYALGILDWTLFFTIVVVNKTVLLKEKILTIFTIDGHLHT